MSLFKIMFPQILRNLTINSELSCLKLRKMALHSSNDFTFVINAFIFYRVPILLLARPEVLSLELVWTLPSVCFITYLFNFCVSQFRIELILRGIAYLYSLNKLLIKGHNYRGKFYLIQNHSSMDISEFVKNKKHPKLQF